MSAFHNIDFSGKQQSCNLTYIGRNGTGKCAGLEVAYLDHVGRIQLTPFNSKGSLANCSIDIPADKETIDALCEALQKISTQTGGA